MHQITSQLKATPPGDASPSSRDRRWSLPARWRGHRPRLAAVTLALLGSLGGAHVGLGVDVIWAPFEIKAIEFPPGYDPVLCDFNSLTPGLTPPVEFEGGLPYVRGQFSSPGGLWVVNPFTDPQDLVLSVATDSDPLDLHFTSGNVGALAFDRLCLTDDSGALVDGQFSITISLANGATSERTWTTTAADPITYGGLMSFDAPLISATLTTLDANRFVSVDDVRVGVIPEPRACALAAALGVAAYALFRRRFGNRPHSGDTRCQPCRLGSATILGLALAAWQTVHASTPTTLIDTRPYWPLIPGMVWTYRNAQNPQHVTRVEVRQVTGLLETARDGTRPAAGVPLPRHAGHAGGLDAERHDLLAGPNSSATRAAN